MKKGAGAVLRNQGTKTAGRLSGNLFNSILWLNRRMGRSSGFCRLCYEAHAIFMRGQQRDKQRPIWESVSVLRTICHATQESECASRDIK